MIIRQLTIRQLRIIEQAELELAPGVNLFCGGNGTGKTSLLEAVHVLATGRSFRAPRLDTLRRHGAEELLLAALIEEGEELRRLGLGKGPQGLRLRVDGQAAERQAELARHLAIITLHADSDQLVQGGPQQRRRYLDWWLFHLRPPFHAAWLRYQRLLKQRNAALRADPSQLAAWDEALAQAGEAVAAFRREAAWRLMGQMERHLGEFLDIGEFSWTLYAGWGGGEGLLECLSRTRVRDREQGFTAQGPHRADLRLLLDGREAKEVLSRGQQKAFATLMLLALAEGYAEEREARPVILLDDLAAELDAQHRERLLGHLQRLNAQLLLTALDEAELTPWLPASTRRFVMRGGMFDML